MKKKAIALFLGLNVFIGSQVALAAGTHAEYLQELYDNLIARKETFTIKSVGDPNVVVGDLKVTMDEVMDLRDKKSSDDFDYLRWNWKSWGCTLKQNEDASIDITYNVEYREPKERLDKVHQVVKEIVPMLKGKNDFETIKNIHDFVISQINYDETLQRYTAFEGLLENSTVCQGYSLLAYKLLTEAGIPVRAMEGYAGEAHMWNIVQLGGKWYFLDTTWDDPITGGKPVLR